MRTTGPRRRALTLVVAVLVAGLTGCGGVQPDPATNPPAPGPASPAPTASTSSPPPTPSAEPTTAPTPAGPTREPTPQRKSCAKRVARMSPEQQAGQLLMVGVTSTGLTSSEAAALDASEAGSVVLLGNSGRGIRATATVVDDVRSAATPPRGVGVLVAADQEGGEVQRLRGPGFATIPSATAQTELSNAELRRSAAAWGRQLKQAGVDVDLAPVADVVPKALTSTNAPIGRLRRGYGSSPRGVADKVEAFRSGMGRAGIGTAVKHFPGLGQVRGNTDFTARVVDRVTTRKDPALAGFRAAIDSEVDMVMVSSAYYAKIDAKRRAAYSPVIIDDLLRSDFGYSGVVISDDLSAVAMRDLPVGERAIRFIEAGGDLAIIGQAADGPSMTKAVADRAEDDDAFAARVAESAKRVVALKARLGLASC